MILLKIYLVQSITLNEQASKKIVETLVKFELNPKDERYYYEVVIQIDDIRRPIFIWSPLNQFSVELSCPVHNCPYTPGRWTSNLHTAKSKNNPRLIYCLYNNIILIQQYYTCNRGGHETLSASDEIFNQLSEKELKYFRYRKYSRSMFSFKLIDFIFEQIGHGSNFQQISEIISNLHFIARSWDENQQYSFHEDKLVAFPSKDKLMEVFLDVFQERKLFYHLNVNEIPELNIDCLAADHTFKISKNIGGYREIDDKYQREDMKLFIVLDETQRIVGWQLTKTCQHDEIKGLLTNIKNKLKKKLECVIVDNCCESSSLFQNIFPEIPIKLDLFHAVQRLTRCLENKKSPESRQVSNDIGLIFRDINDRSSIRHRPTPSATVINENLQYFLKKHEMYFAAMTEHRREDFFHHLSNLQKHIDKSCLSDLQPGEGTESNERLHRYLNYNCLGGS